jgi:hypothetical protein
MCGARLNVVVANVIGFELLELARSLVSIPAYLSRQSRIVLA